MFEALADAVVWGLLGLSPEQAFAASLHFFIMDVTKILVLLVLVIYSMGWLRGMLRPEEVREFLRRRSNLSARFFAVGLGAITPFCSCSSVPLFIGFVEAGIPLGITFSFLIASPMINEVAVVVLAATLGWKLTLLYVLTGLSVALIGGFVLERFRPERWVEGYVWQIRMGQVVPPAIDRSLAGRHAYAVSQVKEIVGRLWKFVLLGVGIGALIHGYVPMAWLSFLAGDGGLLSVIGAVLIGIPLYSDAVGVIAIAEALLNKGVPVGTVLAFMMAVAALSLPEMIILRKVVKWSLLALFAAYLALAFILVGVLFNALRTYL